MRRFPRRWWIPGAVLTTGLAAVFTWIAPVVLSPIFNRFEPLPTGSQARADVLELGREAGVDIGEVYRIDASRRVTSLNAFVDGIGSTKRVVLYDNLLDQAERPELRSVVAHELGHVAHADIRRGLIFVAIVAPFGLLFARELSLAIARRRGIDPASPAAVPIYLLALFVAGFVLNIPGNQLSRKIEASADQFALELTDDPRSADRPPAAAGEDQPLGSGSAGLVQRRLRHPPDHGRADRRRTQLPRRMSRAIALRTAAAANLTPIPQ